MGEVVAAGVATTGAGDGAGADAGVAGAGGVAGVGAIAGAGHELGIIAIGNNHVAVSITPYPNKQYKFTPSALHDFIFRSGWARTFVEPDDTGPAPCNEGTNVR